MPSALRMVLRALAPQAVRRELHRSYERALLVGTIIRTLAARFFFWKRGPRQEAEYRSAPAFANTGAAQPRALRVLMISGSYPPMRCGVGDYTARLGTSLSQISGLSLRVLTSTSVKQPDDPPWLHREVAVWNGNGLAPYRRLLDDFRPDIVHVQYPTQGYLTWAGPATIPAIARRQRDMVVVETWHEYPAPLPTMAGCALLVMGAAADALVYVRPNYEERLTGVLRKVIGDIPRHFIQNGPSVPAIALTQAEREQLRANLGASDRRIVAHFGFAYRHKGVHHLFSIADPREHHIVLIGELREDDPYHAEIMRLARSPRWHDRVTLYGFAAPDDVARILAAADAAVFPFEDGGGIWNSSVHAATSQGTFTLLTSREKSGYASAENVYYAVPGAIDEMKSALREFAGRRVVPRERDEWREIAQKHLDIYRSLLCPRP